jgi:hypothetical protein
MHRASNYWELNTHYHFKYLKQENLSKSSVSSESAQSFVWNFRSTLNCSVSKSCKLASKTRLCLENVLTNVTLLSKRHETQSKRAKINWGFQKYLIFNKTLIFKSSFLILKSRNIFHNHVCSFYVTLCSIKFRRKGNWEKKMILPRVMRITRIAEKKLKWQKLDLSVNFFSLIK